MGSVREYFANITGALGTTALAHPATGNDKPDFPPFAEVSKGYKEVPAPDGTHKRHLEIVELLEKRVSAPLAREAFVDHTPEDVLKAAAEARAKKRENRLLRQEGDQGRMTKKKRRDWTTGRRGFFD